MHSLSLRVLPGMLQTLLCVPIPHNHIAVAAASGEGSVAAVQREDGILASLVFHFTKKHDDVCVCMYVCVHVFMCVYMCMCVCVSVCVCM